MSDEKIQNSNTKQNLFGFLPKQNIIITQKNKSQTNDF